MIRIIFAFLLMFSLPALADDADVCRLLPNHKPSADVAFKPGVDVNGKAVVSADLAPPAKAMPEKVVVPMTVDMAQYMNMADRLPEGMELDANLGSMEIYPDGQVLYNGQDITSNANTACGGKKDNILAADKPIEDSGEISGEGH